MCFFFRFWNCSNSGIHIYLVFDFILHKLVKIGIQIFIFYLHLFISKLVIFGQCKTFQNQST